MKEVHTLYKLIFLYLLDRVEFPLTNGQICAFVAEEQYTDYFTVQETLADMVESKLLETELVRNSTFYSLTDSGKETLSYFKDDISTAIRKDIENYLKKNKMKLRDENAVLADYSNLDEGRFSVKLQIKEKDNYIVDMTLVVPDERQAIMLCDNWKKKKFRDLPSSDERTDVGERDNKK